ncbi:hypothetical protein HPP92_013162 [Vanilla planifolia]|uniref:Uncharacterized protein n=1 Tax=Vanilla planifolia TaxID=51239 RepID=A0A835UYD2_VANPL|nr:hypothetical protein HPP92_013162 [Vanilla planifolia]
MLHCLMSFLVVLALNRSCKGVILLKVQKNKKPTSNSLSSPFLVPQIFVCIFRFLASCNDKASRTKILEDLLDLLESELSNTEAFMEHAWSSWLTTSVKLITLNSCEWELKSQDDTSRIHEIALIRNLYCVVLSHYVYSVKGGWYMLEETVNFLLLNYEQFLEFGMSSSMPSDLPLSENQDISSAVLEVLNLEYKDILSRTCWSHNSTAEEADVEDVRWVLYDKLWSLITEMSGKGQSKTLPKSTTLSGPSFGQRARGLVESLNIPAAEMAAVVVSGGIGTALGLLLAVRKQHGMLDDGARFHVISHLILELVNHGKLMLATSILGREDTFEVTNNSKETGFILSLIQKDRVLAAAAEEAKYTKDTKDERKKQLEVLKAKLDEFSLAEHVQLKAFEEDIMSAIDKIISSNDSRKVAFQLAYDEHQQIVTDSWIRMFRTLIDERGPWSANPFPNNNVTHWKLDKTEDNWRRRSKLKRNYKFCKDLCYPQTNKISEEPNPSEDCNNVDGRNFPDQMKRFLLKGVQGITGERPMELPDGTMDSTAVKDSDISSFSETQASYDRNDNDGSIDILHDGKYLSTISSELESDEVHLSSSCILISPKRKLAGRLFVMRNVLHFTCQFIVEGTGGSSVFNNISDGSTSDASKLDHLYVSDKNNQNNGVLGLEFNRGKSNDFNILAQDNLLRSKPNKIKKHRRWSILKIKAVHWTRYLLQYTALEIFFSDSVAPIFLNFAKPKDAKHVGTLIVSLRNEAIFPKANSRDRSGMISFVDRRVALEMAETFRECWRRRKKYPVFPWVLADYSSEKLDFNKSSTFRDLSKPVGALDSKRFEVFEDRFLNFSDPDIPSFYYGSHYSSMGIVLFYLLRMEPFTALHRSLQYRRNLSKCHSNTSDVKELIPEFFYMPEFLINSNSYYFGVKQDGEAIGDVILPHGQSIPFLFRSFEFFDSPEEFICQNREALESEYVSSNLHHWIDLIFGYKQRGKPAMEAANVFYYLTYEGAVDLESTENALQRSAIEDQIANFGQTPIQLFRKKHPRRGPPIPVAHPLYFAPSSITLTSIVSNVTNPSSAVIFIGLLDSNIVVVNHELILSVKLWLSTQLQSGVSYTFSGSQEPFFGIGADVFPHRKIATSLANDLADGKHRLSKLQKLNENYLILCGSWENSFQVISVHDGKIVQSIRQHKDLVSCIAVVADGSILATGSFDTTVMVWHIYKGKFTEKKAKTMQSDYNRKDHVIIGTPFHILCGHDDVITCLFISRELDIVISGSNDATCVFHTLREGRYVRSIQHPSGCPISKLVASQHGRMVIYADNDLSLHMYSINGKYIASSESNGRLNCIELSASGDFLVCAGDHGQIVLRSMHSLDVLQRFEGIGKVITSVKVTPEECILAGTKDGCLLLYSLDNLQLRRGSLPRNAKS